MNAHDTTTEPRPIPWDEYQRRALIVGIAGLVVSGLTVLISPRWFFPSYLVAFLYWTGIGVGSLAILTLHYLVGGAWGFVIRRPLEAAVMTLPLMAVLFVPIFFGMKTLYPWADASTVAGDAILKQKQPYLNVGFFLIRSAIYFILWCGLALAFSRGGGRRTGPRTRR